MPRAWKTAVAVSLAGLVSESVEEMNVAVLVTISPAVAGPTVPLMVNWRVPPAAIAVVLVQYPETAS